MPSTPRGTAGAVPSTPRGAVPSTPRGRTAPSGSSRGGNAALAALPAPGPMTRKTFAPAVPGLTSPEVQPPVRCGCKTCDKFVQRWYIHNKFGCFVARCDRIFPHGAKTRASYHFWYSLNGKDWRATTSLTFEMRKLMRKEPVKQNPRQARKFGLARTRTRTLKVLDVPLAEIAEDIKITKRDRLELATNLMKDFWEAAGSTIEKYLSEHGRKPKKWKKNVARLRTEMKSRLQEQVKKKGLLYPKLLKHEESA
ncbi:Sacs [Symbiodinium sp. CCMP2592]|nr:Sacs [Symbiodinium sp. CCMP2592]